MDKKICIINGMGKAGKDTFCEFCSHFISVLNISSVDKVKEAATVLDWDGSKDEKSRKFLSDLKFLSSNYNNQPYRYIEKNIQYFKRDNAPYQLMFIHIREPEEIDKIKNDFGCITLLVKNNNVKDIISNEADANVNNYTYDYIIDNSDDLQELRAKAYDFVMTLFMKENA